MGEARSFKPVRDVLVGYKRVRTKRLWAGLAVSVVMVLLGVALITYPPMSSKHYHVSSVLKPQQYYKMWFSMEKGEKLIISGTVSGGNNDILIFIKEGQYKVRDFGWVDSPVHVVFTAPEDGNYTLYISNGMSLVTSKELDLDVIYQHHDYGPGAVLFVLGIISLVIFGVSLAIGQKELIIKANEETYEFRGTFRGLKVRVNGIDVNTKVRPGDKFKIGSNDDHILEVKYVRGRWGSTKYGIFIDGREVGRL